MATAKTLRGFLDALQEEEVVSPETEASVLSDWAQRGDAHVEFRSGDLVPLRQVRFLGSGGSGSVDEVDCRGVLLARKLIKAQRGDYERIQKELHILRKLSHKHVVKLIGSYIQGDTHPRTLGLLLSPVAACDLAVFLKEFNYFPIEDTSESCWAALGLHTAGYAGIPLHPLAFLRRIFGCLACATAYLHDSKIRHKDLKPHNILLSKGGVFVADFGTAIDFTELSLSITEGNERGTRRYFAPELRDLGARGRSADIYSLGCVYLEIATILCGESIATMEEFWMKNDSDLPFRFHENPKQVEGWLKHLNGKPAQELPSKQLLALIERMLRFKSKDRPEAAEIVEELYRLGGTPSLLHAPCCGGPSLSEELFQRTAELRLAGESLQLTNKSLEVQNQEISAQFSLRISEMKLAEESLQLANRRLEKKNQETSEKLSQLTRRIAEMKLAGESLQLAGLRLEKEKQILSVQLDTAVGHTVKLSRQITELEATEESLKSTNRSLEIQNLDLSAKIINAIDRVEGLTRSLTAANIEIAEFQAGVNQLGGAIVGLQGRVSALASTERTLINSLDGARQNIQTLRTQVTRESHTRVVLEGMLQEARKESEARQGGGVLDGPPASSAAADKTHSEGGLNSQSNASEPPLPPIAATLTTTVIPMKEGSIFSSKNTPQISQASTPASKPAEAKTVASGRAAMRARTATPVAMKRITFLGKQTLATSPASAPESNLGESRVAMEAKTTLLRKKSSFLGRLTGSQDSETIRLPHSPGILNLPALLETQSTETQYISAIDKE